MLFFPAHSPTYFVAVWFHPYMVTFQSPYRGSHHVCPEAMQFDPNKKADSPCSQGESACIQCFPGNSAVFIKTRGFPSPPFDGFGFFRNAVYYYQQFLCHFSIITVYNVILNSYAIIYLMGRCGENRKINAVCKTVICNLQIACSKVEQPSLKINELAKGRGKSGPWTGYRFCLYPCIIPQFI